MMKDIYLNLWNILQEIELCLQAHDVGRMFSAKHDIPSRTGRNKVLQFNFLPTLNP